MPVFFAGRQLVTPTVETHVNDEVLLPQATTLGNSLALVGSSEGGAPYTPTVMRSVAHARSVLRSGELLQAVEKAFLPSLETARPSTIYAVRVDPATQATKTLLNGSAGNAIVLTATDYGVWTNTIRVKVESGTSAGKKVTINQGDAYYIQDNIDRTAFTMTYTGANGTATASVSATALTLVDSGTTTILFAEYPNVASVVSRVNTVTGWSATVATGGASLATANTLDGLTAEDAKNKTVTVKGVLQAVIDWINAGASDLVTAARASGAMLVPANVAYTYLAGAVNGSVSSTEWGKCFDALETVDVQWIVPLSSTDTIWAQADTHVQYMSVLGRRERRCLVGAGTGVPMATAIASAAAINSDRTSYVYPGFYDLTASGELQLYPAYHLAAICAAALAGLAPGEPLTNKTLQLRGLEKISDKEIAMPSDTDYLDRGRVMAVYRDGRGGYRVAHSITTWSVSDNFNRTEVSVGVALDYVVRTVRERLQRFVGRKANLVSLAGIIEATASVLRTLTEPEPYGVGVLAGDNDNPSFKNINAEIVDDAVRVEFECSPVLPINYILVAVYTYTYGGQLSLAR